MEREFLWAVGIEDTFLGQPHRRTGRVLDEYELTGHYASWREDLDRLRELGVTHVRYGIPWYRVNPAPGVFDWTWIDAVMPYLVQDARLQPIVDLMHYGCPLWLEREFLNAAYPESVAAYAAAFAERYRGLVRYFTPLNEPLVNAFFCGQSGSWPPHVRGPRGYARLLVALAKGMSATIAALRSALEDAVIVQVEASARVVAGEPALEPYAERAFWKQFLATDLVLGAVDDGHVMLPWLLERGVGRDDLEALRRDAQRIDVMGINFYPTMSTSRVTANPAGGEPLSRNYYASADDLCAVLAAFHEHFRLPVMITETSDLARVSRRAHWMDESIAAVRDARAAGVPVVGYTWFPVYSHISWDYRGGRRPLSEYWCHMGLWEIRDDGRDSLARLRTPLVDRYAALVAGGHGAVGPLVVAPRAPVAPQAAEARSA